jgi:hypothetical protein
MKKFILLLIFCSIYGCQNTSSQDLVHLQFISLSMELYQNASGKMPSNITDKDGKPLLSWRVALLQFGGAPEINLYKQFKLDESWNSPHNLKVAQTVPFIYIDPQGPKCTPVTPISTSELDSVLWTMDSKRPNYTPYLGVTGPKAAFRPEPRNLNKGDPYNYAAIVIVDKSDVFWTEPRDIPVEKVENSIRWYKDITRYINTQGFIGDREKKSQYQPVYEFE